MLQLPCPYCGPRDELEFSCGGEAHISRPLANNKISDAAFGDICSCETIQKACF